MDLATQHLADDLHSLAEGSGIRASKVQPQIASGRLGWEPAVAGRDRHTAHFAVAHQLCRISGIGQPNPQIQSALAFAAVQGGGLGGLHTADLLLFGAVLACAIGYAEGGLLSRELGSWQTISWALALAAPVMLTLTAI